MRYLLLMCCFVFLFSAFGGTIPVAKTTEISFEAFEDPAHIWLPENYDPEKKWPVIFYYHGTSGKPTIEFMRRITEGRDWVLVGLGYKQGGRFDYTEENLATEIAVFEEVRSYVIQTVSIDPDKIYLSGMSKGGWMTGLFLQKNIGLAGGIIFGGGLIAAKTSVWDPGDKVFIGVGEVDGNIAMSYGARDQMKAVGLGVTLDVWPGVGHQFPSTFNEEHCMSLRQWLKIQSAGASEDEASTWLERELRNIQKLRVIDKISGLHELIRISNLPFTALADAEARGLLLRLQTEVRGDAELKDEMAAWILYQTVTSREGKDRYVETLAECLGQYQKISDQYPNTRLGKKAIDSRERIKLMLGLD